jgi:hypothetical protein
MEKKIFSIILYGKVRLLSVTRVCSKKDVLYEDSVKKGISFYISTKQIKKNFFC